MKAILSLSPIRAVAFDLNGVLVDDEVLHEAAFRVAFRRRGLLLTRTDYQTYFAGRSDEDGIRGYARHVRRNLAITDLVSAKRSSYARSIAFKVPQKRDAVACLRKFGKMGLKIAVVTGAPIDEAESSLAAMRIRHYVTAIVAAEQVKNSKPSPEPYSTALKLMGVESSKCIAIEDSPAGIASAKAAGLFCIAVTDLEKTDSLRQADVIVHTLNSQLFEKFAVEV